MTLDKKIDMGYLTLKGQETKIQIKADLDLPTERTSGRSKREQEIVNPIPGFGGQSGVRSLKISSKQAWRHGTNGASE
jgi:hypothetical protein